MRQLLRLLAKEDLFSSYPSFHTIHHTSIIPSITMLRYWLINSDIYFSFLFFFRSVIFVSHYFFITPFFLSLPSCFPHRVSSFRGTHLYLDAATRAYTRVAKHFHSPVFVHDLRGAATNSYTLNVFKCIILFIFYSCSTFRDFLKALTSVPFIF